MKTPEFEVLAFKEIVKFRAWLAKNHESTPGLWLRLFKKASGEKTISYEEALHEALCFGWIDGLKRPYDDKSWIQKFTPRRKKSVWSKRNTAIIEKLIQEKRMKPAGMKVVEDAKADGRWDQAYDSPKDMKLELKYLSVIKKNKKAYEFYQTLNKTNLFAIAWRIHTAKKDETKDRRLEAIIQMLARGEKLH